MLQVINEGDMFTRMLVEDLGQDYINQQMVVKHGKRLTKGFLGLRLEELEWIFPMQILR